MSDKKRTRLHPDQRRKQIVDAAINIAVKDGWESVVAHNIANTVGVSYGLVQGAFDTMTGLRRAVINEVLDRMDGKASPQYVPVIAAAIRSGDMAERKVSAEIKSAVLDLLM